MKKFNITQFQADLLKWYHSEKRDLSWRKTSNPFYIWVSEIMLQQTQVKTVLPYYNRFIQKYPDIQSFAKANLNDVLKEWEGLGYYSRARNLHQAANQVINEFGGQIPHQPDDFRKLKGVGEYTVAAVLSIAFGKALPAVDGNVKRVLSRLHLLNDPVNSTSQQQSFMDQARKQLYKQDPGSYNQAMMELGALICKPANPLCDQCPVKKHCQAFAGDVVHLYPVRVKKPPIPLYHLAAGVIIKGDKLLITRRKEEGLLGGLWEFPGGKLEKGESAESACLREIREETNLSVDIITPLATVKHQYSHFKIEMNVFICRCHQGRVKLNGPIDFHWIKPDQISSFAFPKANHKFFKQLLDYFLQKEVTD